MEDMTTPFHAGDGPLVLATVRKRRIEMYTLFKREVRELKSGYSSPALTLFGIFIGAGVAFSITSSTVNMTVDVGTRFALFTYVSFGLAAISAVQAFRDWRKACHILDEVERETVEIGIMQGSKELPPTRLS